MKAVERLTEESRLKAGCTGHNDPEQHPRVNNQYMTLSCCCSSMASHRKLVDLLLCHGFGKLSAASYMATMQGS